MKHSYRLDDVVYSGYTTTFTIKNPVTTKKSWFNPQQSFKLNQNTLHLLNPKTVMQEGESWTTLVALFKKYEQDATESNLSAVNRHIIWHGSSCFHEIPEQYDYMSLPYNFWSIFRHAADWSIVQPLLWSVPHSIIEKYLAELFTAHRPEDFNVIMQRADMEALKHPKWAKTQYGSRSETITAEEAVAALNECYAAEGNRKASLKQSVLRTKNWDGDLPENFAFNRYSSSFWKLVLSNLNHAAISNLLRQAPEWLLETHFMDSSKKAAFQVERDINIVASRKDKEHIPVEWLKTMYISKI